MANVPRLAKCSQTLDRHGCLQYMHQVYGLNVFFNIYL